MITLRSISGGAEIAELTRLRENSALIDSVGRDPIGFYIYIPFLELLFTEFSVRLSNSAPQAEKRLNKLTSNGMFILGGGIKGHLHRLFSDALLEIDHPLLTIKQDREAPFL
jgi:hypothetical protein